MFMDKYIRNIGVGHHGETLAYADDVSVVVDSIKDIQEIIKWHQEMSKRGMKVHSSKGKIKFMLIN